MMRTGLLLLTLIGLSCAGPEKRPHERVRKQIERNRLRAHLEAVPELAEDPTEVHVAVELSNLGSKPLTHRDFAEAFLGIPGCIDLTVTSPYKATAYRCISSLSREIQVAERVDHLRCLNHIIVNPVGGRTAADITDGLGMSRALKKRKTLQGAEVLLAGAGGAATAIGYEIVHSLGSSF